MKVAASEVFPAQDVLRARFYFPECVWLPCFKFKVKIYTNKFFAVQVNLLHIQTVTHNSTAAQIRILKKNIEGPNVDAGKHHPYLEGRDIWNI